MVNRKEPKSRTARSAAHKPPKAKIESRRAARAEDRAKPRKAAKGASTRKNLAKQNANFDDRALWRNISDALGTELRDDTKITGASGITHHVQGISVDDKNGRVVVIAAEASAQTAALMGIDIQATIDDAKVIIARPVALDLIHLAKEFFRKYNATEVDFGAIVKEEEAANGLRPWVPEALDPFGDAVTKAKLPIQQQIVSFIHQAAYLDWEKIVAAAAKGPPEEFKLPLDDLLPRDSMAIDRELGVCPLPLYQFDSNDWHLFGSKGDRDAATARLKALGVHQFFFPPPDQTVLGMLDRKALTVAEAQSALDKAPEIGHPHGESELFQSGADAAKILEEFKGRNIAGEVNFRFELEENGRRIRVEAEHRPQEGFFVRLARALKLEIHQNFTFK